MATLPQLYILIPLLYSLCASSGYNISSGRTFSSNSSGVRNPNATVASFSVVPSLCAFFAHLATSTQTSVSALTHPLWASHSLSYPRWLFRIVANINDSFNSELMRFSFASMPTTQFFVNDRAPGYKSSNQHASHIIFQLSPHRH